MAAKATGIKDTSQGPRPLPPTPKKSPTTAIAKEALKGPAPLRYPSFYKSARPLSGNIKIPDDPNTLTRLISQLVDQANDLNQRENSIKLARELLDEVFVEVCLSDEDYQTRQAWLESLLLGYYSILGLARYHNIEAPEARLVLICNTILSQIKLELSTEATETPAVSETSARPLDYNLIMPGDSYTLSRLISLLVERANDSNQREASIKQARELLDEVFVKVFLSDEDYLARQAWLNSLLLGSDSILSFAKYYKMETFEARFSLICTKILKQIELELKTEATETPAVSEAGDPLKKPSSRRLTWKIVRISLAIFALAGLFFAARIGINHYLNKK